MRKKSLLRGRRRLTFEALERRELLASLQLVPNWGASGVPSTLSMYIYVPDKVAAKPPVMVLCHYWGATAGAVFAEAVGGGLVAAADQYGFIIVAPQTSNPDGTGRGWDANSTASLTHNGGGETQGIAEMVTYTINTYHADASRVYATGTSSGAMMTEALLATYPDVFKAGVEFAGVPAGSWSAGNPDPGGWSGLSASGQVTHTAQQWGDMVRAMYPGYSGPRPRIQLWHGTADNTISYENQTEAIKEWTNVLGLSTNPTSTATVTIGNNQYTHQAWQDSLGNTLLDAWSEINGPHGTDANFDAAYEIPFLNLDDVGSGGSLSGAQDADIGSPSPAGSSSYNADSDIYTVAGGGADIGGTTDQFHNLSKSFTGDGSIVARVTSEQNTATGAKAGVMFRDSTAAGAMYADVVVSVGQGATFQWRSSTGGSSGAVQATALTAPIWVKLVRSGNSFSAFYATTPGTPTASDWIAVGTAQTIAMSSSAQAGLAVTSQNNGTLCTSTFSGVQLGSLGSFSTSLDVGSPSPAGSSSYNAATGTYTVAGGGADIWGSTDQFQYLSQSLTGYGSIVARVTGVQNTNTWAKAGVMFRDSTGDAYNTNASILVTPGQGVSFQWRSSTGGSSSNVVIPGVAAPAWVKLVRNGNGVSAFYSKTAGTPTTSDWIQVGTAQTIAIGTTVQAGLAVTSHSNGTLCTATFTNMALTSIADPPPTVATAAAASQLPPPSAASANLSVLGADDGGETNLIYTWATTGTPPAAVNFSSNGQNASKNTVATFSAVGSYSFVVTITDQFGASTTSAVSLTVNQAVNSIAISPSGATLAPNGSKQFTATAYDQFGALVSNPAGIVWSNSNSNVGSINASTGLYSAGNLQGITTITATAGAASGSAAVAVTTLPAPKAWYRFDESSGTTAADSSGNGRTGTLVNGPAWTTGESSGGLAFNGTSQYVTVPALNLNSNTVTMSAWIKRSGTPSDYTGVVFYRNGSGTASGISLRSTGALAYHWNDANGTWNWASGLTVPDGVWTFVALVITPSNATMYMQPAGGAMQSAVNAVANAIQAFSGVIDIGQDTLGGRFFNGSADDVRIYNTSLSAAQVTQLYSSYFPPTVATAAAANPTTVAATTSALSTLGASILGESALKYTWSAIGSPPASVNFSVNGTNAAKSTLATFSQAGTYTLAVAIVDTQNQAITSQVTVTVQQTLTSLTVSPSTATINSGGSQQFSATAYDQFGAAMTPQPAFTWSVVSGGVGSINSSSGLYTSSAAGSATVKATSSSVNNTASVTVTNPAPTVATPAAANPSPVTGTTTSLSVLGASGGGEANLSYTWSMTSGPATVNFSANGTNAAKNSVATFSQAGGYQFTVTITDQNSLSTTSAVNVTVNHTLQGGVSISPAAANITAGNTQQFTLMGQDQFGQAFTVADPVSWQLTGPGSLGVSSGLYTPPYINGSATVQATYGAFNITPAMVTFSGQAQWNASANASWNANGGWKDSIGGGTVAAPGTRGIFGDTVLFASATGPMARLDGANPTLAGITFNSAATSYTIAQGSGGSLTLQGTNGATVSVLAGNDTISAPLHLASDTIFSAAATSGLTISGPIDGSGGVTLTGSGMLTLSGANSYTGSTVVNGGTLQFSGVSANLGTRAITANGGAVQYVNATINGGTLAAQGVPGGTHTTLAGGTSSFSGTAISARTPFVANGPTTFTDVTNYGPMTANSMLSWTGGTNAASGSLAVNGTLETSEFTTAGNITIANGGVLDNSVTNLTAYNGAQITVNSGGTLNADSQNEGMALNLQNCLLVNNGTITGTTNIGYGAIVQGSGTFGQVNVASGGTLSMSPIANLAAAGITVTGGTIAGSGNLASPITIQSTAVVSTNAGGTVEFSGGLTGNGSLTTQGTGTVVLSGVGKYTGGTVVGGGTVIVTSAAALPDGSSLTVGAGSYFSAAPLVADAIATRSIDEAPMLRSGSQTAPVPPTPFSAAAHDAVMARLGPNLPAAAPSVPPWIR